MTDTEFDATDYVEFLAALPATAVAILCSFDTGTEADLDDALDALHDLDPHPDQPHGLATFAAFLMLKLGGWSVVVIERLGASVEHTGPAIAAALGDPVLPDELADDEVVLMIHGRNLAARMYLCGLTQDEDGIQALLDSIDTPDLMGYVLAACVDLCSVIAHMLQDLAATVGQSIPNPN